MELLDFIDKDTVCVAKLSAEIKWFGGGNKRTSKGKPKYEHKRETCIGPTYWHTLKLRLGLISESRNKGQVILG